MLHAKSTSETLKKDFSKVLKDEKKIVKDLKETKDKYIDQLEDKMKAITTERFRKDQ